MPPFKAKPAPVGTMNAPRAPVAPLAGVAVVRSLRTGDPLPLPSQAAPGHDPVLPWPQPATGVDHLPFKGLKLGDSMADGKTSPFDGTGKTSGDASGAHNFLTDNKGSGPTGGGRDFTKESRPQSLAKSEVAPNPQEIPAGGKDMRANAGSVSAKTTGTGSIGNSAKPFKLKG